MSSNSPRAWREQRKQPLTAAISRDDGRTWGLQRNIEIYPRHEFDYPSISFLRDQVLLTYHETEWMSEKLTDWRRNLKLKVMPLDWFYAA